ncbi:unnamed protein product [Clonostachys rosea]|uniref:AA1-like domain-containing protein n=1 Tax=Bionectria ochroleuca TaxID=29856 RepID=A0ABY6UVY5_BIOOC|nr:unnamed protein product [Clonostachys rosea]
MKFTSATLALLAGFAAAQSQPVNIANLYLVGNGDLATGAIELDVISFTLDEDTVNEISCSALHDITFPTGRISGGCVSIGSNRGEQVPWDFSLDEITNGSDIKLTLWNTQDGERTGSGIIPNICKANGAPERKGFFCDQEEPEDDVIVIS